MIINSKMLSLPPFISTSWDNVRSLHWDRGTDLVVTLADDSKVVIPQLPILLIHQVFKVHSEFLDSRPGRFEPRSALENLEIFKGSLGDIKLDEMNSINMDVIEAPFIHNPEQANFPDLPESLLNKMTTALKVIGLEQFESMPQAEPHCNCLFCQVSRTVHQLRDETPAVEAAAKPPFTTEDEIVTAEDLRFKEWDIVQLDNTRYQVTNPLDTNETFLVYLGDTIGCNCGRTNCEHITAVLRS